MLENVKVQGVHATRWIMSWIRSGGDIYYTHNRDDFDQWLISEGVEASDRELLREMFRGGKMELERSASKFVKALPPTEWL